MNRTFSLLCKIFAKPLIDAAIIKKISGKKNLPAGNFILAANHQSNLDHVVLGCVCFPRSFKFIGQIDGHKGLNNFLVKLFYSLTGVIILDRQNDDSKRIVLEQAAEFAKKGDIIGLYPEGTRSRTGHIGKAKTGVAKIFLDTGLPIVPIAVKGTFDLMPPHGKLKIKKLVEIIIGQPLYFKKELRLAKGLSFEDEKYKDLCQKITDKVMNEISNLANDKPGKN
jgi:1-acyl-sn-glycerol-3-phosphate acyltransferase